MHVVGQEVIACEVRSTSDDYRYGRLPGDETTIQPCEVPDIQERCVELAHGLHLPFAGIDLRRTPEGAWYCFEVNPSPGFTFYEEATGQPIADAVARFLQAGAQ